MEKVRNNAIDIFRYVCAILVISIHSEPFLEINSSLHYFFVQVVPRIAVPFFFTIAGYYYIKKITQDGVDVNKIFWKYIKKLLCVYSIWSVVYIIVNIFKTGKVDSIMQIVENYFFHGSYIHLWFFPALFFALIMCTFFVKIKKVRVLAYVSIVLYVFGCLGTSYYGIGTQIPLIEEIIDSKYFKLIKNVLSMGLPFL